MSYCKQKGRRKKGRRKYSKNKTVPKFYSERDERMKIIANSCIKKLNSFNDELVIMSFSKLTSAMTMKTGMK